MARIWVPREKQVVREKGIREARVNKCHKLRLIDTRGGNGDKWKGGEDIWGGEL